MTRRLRQDDGWALATAMIVLMLMMSVGLASYALVDTQTTESKRERNREASFNLTEGALQQQGYVMGANWPGTAATAFPDCTSPGSTPVGKCPQPANLVGGNFSQADYNAGVTWSTVIRDNPGGSTSYDSSVDTTPCQGTSTVPCSWDANGDRNIWVRARATVKGKTRTIIALLKRERLTEGFPRATLKADHFTVTNNGNKTMIDSTGGQIVTRCQNVPSGGSCADYDPSKNQVIPSGAIVQEPPQTQPTMDAGQLSRFKSVAQSANTYYTSCPSSLAGAVVYIDLAVSGDCTYNSNSIFNSATVPGFVIMPKGTLTFAGGATFYGVIYLANQQGSTGAVADLGGNCLITGGIIIDGGGGMNVGSSKENLVYSANAFNSLSTYGTAGLVQNTWRELPPGS